MTAIQAALDGLPEVPLAAAVTARTLLEALHCRYGFTAWGARRYAVAEDVPSRTGQEAPRRADFMAFDTWRSGGFELHGFEVKISRSDWLRELADPRKAAGFIPYVHRWWLVVPGASLVKAGELPEGWGLLALAGGRLRAVRKAAVREPVPLPPERLAALLRAVQKTAGQRAAS